MNIQELKGKTVTRIGKQPWLVWLSRLNTDYEPKGRWFNSQ